MSQINVRNLSNENDDGAPDIVGVSTFSATSYIVPPVGNTAQRPENPQPGDLRFNTDTASLEYYKGDTLGWTQIEMTSPDLNGGARAVFGSGYVTGSDFNDTIDYITISTLGNATDFGNMSDKRMYHCSVGSRTRGYWMGGQTPAANNGANSINYVTISSTGDAADFGDLASVSKSGQACSSDTRGVIALGNSPAPTHVDTMEYFNLSTSGSGKDFGDANTDIRTGGAACASSTRGIFWGGITQPGSPYYGTQIDYITISSTGNASDFGDLNKGRSNVPASFSNSTRGILAGGLEQPYAGVDNTIEYITIATLGNATDFGDTVVTDGMEYLSGASSPTRGLIDGGQTGPASTNAIEYVEIMTLGNPKDFGDLTVARFSACGCSNGHGGL